jgi:hypothetical protein
MRQFLNRHLLPFNMAYKKLTLQILNLCELADNLIDLLTKSNKILHQGHSKEIIPTCRKRVNIWENECMKILSDNQLQIELYDFKNYEDKGLGMHGFNEKLGYMYFYMKDRKKLLINICKDIETRNIKDKPDRQKVVDKGSKAYDVFICHASEDKDFVEPLVQELVRENINVWYDTFRLEWGDSLRQIIDRGLTQSNFGIVVFSKNFFNKKKVWTNRELDGLLAKEKNDKKVILPIWHNITRSELEKYSPMFVDRLAKNSHEDSIQDIVRNMKKMLHN